MTHFDFDDDFPTRGPVVLSVTATTMALCSLFVALRLISKFVTVRNAGWDDYAIIVGWLLAFGASFTICYAVSNGLGRRQLDIPYEWLPAMKESSYAFAILYNPALMTTKTSILLLYLTFSKTQKIFRWATITTLIVVDVGGLALTVLNILQCQPIAAAWAAIVPPSASCTDIVTIYLSSAPLNIITDLAILFLPMPILTSIRLPKKQKLILIITFGFGIFAAVIDIARIAYLQEAQRDALENADFEKSKTGNIQRNNNDFSWYVSLAFMWSAVEINVGIMCACVPALKPLARKFLPVWFLDATTCDGTATHPSGQAALHQVPADVRTHDYEDALAPTASSSARPSRRSDINQPIDIIDFLTSADVNDQPQKTSACVTLPHETNTVLRRRSIAFFDFVDKGQKKNITLRNNRESMFPILMVTILFFVWGFAYGFLNVLNLKFQEISRSNDWYNVGQHSAYYFGYFVGPLTFGRLVFKLWGFKACYMVGLSVYACGTLIFWPSAVTNSFPAFLISNFIVGAGLSTLELGANPFIALCGPPEYAEVRLNLSQAVQAVGAILSPVLAQKVLFRAKAADLIDVQWTYLGISFFNILLAIMYFYVPLPEATDDDLEIASQRMPIPRDHTIEIGRFSVKILWFGLAMALISLFCCIGGQEATSTTFSRYAAEALPSTNNMSQIAYGHTAFAVSRFLAAVTNIWIKPRYSLLFFCLGAVAFSAAAMKVSGSFCTAVIVLGMFFQGPLFPQIFALGIRGMGKHTKEAAVLLTAAIGGGGFFPPIAFAAIKLRNARYAYCVVVAALACGMLYPVWLNAVPAARRISDPVRDEQSRRETRDTEKVESLSADSRHSKRRNKGKDRPFRNEGRHSRGFFISEDTIRQALPENASASLTV